jgi:two-component system, cell cycle sensor histidine kinase and response regulator CckA
MTIQFLCSSPQALLLLAAAIVAISILVGLLVRLRSQAGHLFLVAQQKQNDAEERFTLAFQLNADPMCISEWDGTIVEVNQRFCELSGYAADELAGLNSIAANLWHKPEEHRTAMVATLRKEGRVRNMEATFRNKAGRIVPALLSVTLLPLENRTCLLSTLRDLSAVKVMEERKRKLEGQLVRTANLEAMGTLVGGLAHRFNNILTSIIGYSELALDDVDASSQTAGDLERILGKAEEARHLVEQILHFSQGQARVKQPVDMFRLLAEAVAKIASQAPEGLRIETRISGKSAIILADPAAMELVILNICRNAFDSMPEGGALIIGLHYPSGTGGRFADADADLPAGNHVHLYFKDTGQGMDALTLERVFNPFFTTKHSGQGTGMGLSVVHGIITDHGGLIRVNSRKGFGSTFHLFFPVQNGEESERAV